MRHIAKRNAETLLSDEADPNPPLHWISPQFTQQLQCLSYQSSAHMVPNHFNQMPAIYKANPAQYLNRNVPWYPPIVKCPHSESGDSNWQVSVDNNVNKDENCEESKVSTRANRIQWNRCQSAAENLDSTFDTYEITSQENSGENESADKEIVYFIAFKP